MQKIKTWAILGLIAMGLALCAGITATVPRMPAAIVDADAKRAAIEPGIEATRMYNRVVVPAVQAQEAEEAKRTVSEREGWQRIVDAAEAVARIAGQVVLVGVALSALVMSLSLGVLAVVSTLVAMAALALWAWERYKRAQAFEPWQKLPDHTIIYPRLGTGRNTLTGEQWKLTTEQPASIVGGKLLIAARPPTFGESVVAALLRRRVDIPRYRVTGHNEPGRLDVLEGMRGVIEA